MSKTILVAMSTICGKNNVEGVFSTREGAVNFCNLENSKIEDFRRADDSYYFKPFEIDEKCVPENLRYKTYWDYKVNIVPDTQDYGQIVYSGSGKDLVLENKSQDVETYEGEVIWCRSYVSKKECENLVYDCWQAYEQKRLTPVA